MTCHICGHEFQVGDGYAFYRDDVEKICKSCHQGWFGSTLHEEHIIQPEDLTPELDWLEKMDNCKHLIKKAGIDAVGQIWTVCEECGKHSRM
jgi:hypothetical protein